MFGTENVSAEANIPIIHSSLQMFWMAERGTDIVRSVTLLDTHAKGPSHLDALGPPRRTEVPTPRIAFVKEFLAKNHNFYGKTKITESPVAELFVFENTKCAKRLEVFVWTIEQVEVDEVWECVRGCGCGGGHREVPRGNIVRHRAFLLKVTDM